MLPAYRTAWLIEGIGRKDMLVSTEGVYYVKLYSQIWFRGEYISVRSFRPSCSAQDLGSIRIQNQINRCLYRRSSMGSRRAE